MAAASPSPTQLTMSGDFSPAMSSSFGLPVPRPVTATPSYAITSAEPYGGAISGGAGRAATAAGGVGAGGSTTSIASTPLFEVTVEHPSGTDEGGMARVTPHRVVASAATTPVELRHQNLPSQLQPTSAERIIDAATLPSVRVTADNAAPGNSSHGSVSVMASSSTPTTPALDDYHPAPMSSFVFPTSAALSISDGGGVALPTSTAVPAAPSQQQQQQQQQPPHRGSSGSATSSTGGGGVGAPSAGVAAFSSVHRTSSDYERTAGGSSTMLRGDPGQLLAPPHGAPGSSRQRRLSSGSVASRDGEASSPIARASVSPRSATGMRSSVHSDGVITPLTGSVLPPPRTTSFTGFMMVPLPVEIGEESLLDLLRLPTSPRHATPEMIEGSVSDSTSVSGSPAPKRLGGSVTLVPAVSTTLAAPVAGGGGGGGPRRFSPLSLLPSVRIEPATNGPSVLAVKAGRGSPKLPTGERSPLSQRTSDSVSSLKSSFASASPAKPSGAFGSGAGGGDTTGKQSSSITQPPLLAQVPTLLLTEPPEEISGARGTSPTTTTTGGALAAPGSAMDVVLTTSGSSTEGTLRSATHEDDSDLATRQAEEHTHHHLNSSNGDDSVDGSSACALLTALLIDEVSHRFSLVTSAIETLAPLRIHYFDTLWKDNRASGRTARDAAQLFANAHWSGCTMYSAPQSSPQSFSQPRKYSQQQQPQAQARQRNALDDDDDVEGVGEEVDNAGQPSAASPSGSSASSLEPLSGRKSASPTGASEKVRGGSDATKWKSGGGSLSGPDSKHSAGGGIQDAPDAVAALMVMSASPKHNDRNGATISHTAADELLPFSPRSVVGVDRSSEPSTANTTTTTSPAVPNLRSVSFSSETPTALVPAAGSGSGGAPGSGSGSGGTAAVAAVTVEGALGCPCCYALPQAIHFSIDPIGALWLQLFDTYQECFYLPLLAVVSALGEPPSPVSPSAPGAAAWWTPATVASAIATARVSALVLCARASYYCVHVGLLSSFTAAGNAGSTPHGTGSLRHSLTTREASGRSASFASATGGTGNSPSAMAAPTLPPLATVLSSLWHVAMVECFAASLPLHWSSFPEGSMASSFTISQHRLSGATAALLQQQQQQPGTLVRSWSHVMRFARRESTESTSTIWQSTGPGSSGALAVGSLAGVGGGAQNSSGSLAHLLLYQQQQQQLAIDSHVAQVVVSHERDLRLLLLSILLDAEATVRRQLEDLSLHVLRDLRGASMLGASKAAVAATPGLDFDSRKRGSGSTNNSGILDASASGSLTRHELRPMQFEDMRLDHRDHGEEMEDTAEVRVKDNRPLSSSRRSEPRGRRVHDNVTSIGSAAASGAAVLSPKPPSPSIGAPSTLRGGSSPWLGVPLSPTPPPSKPSQATIARGIRDSPAAPQGRPNERKRHQRKNSPSSELSTASSSIVAAMAAAIVHKADDDDAAAAADEGEDSVNALRFTDEFVAALFRLRRRVILDVVLNERSGRDEIERQESVGCALLAAAEHDPCALAAARVCMFLGWTIETSGDENSSTEEADRRGGVVNKERSERSAFLEAHYARLRALVQEEIARDAIQHERLTTLQEWVLMYDALFDRQIAVPQDTERASSPSATLVPAVQPDDVAAPASVDDNNATAVDTTVAPNPTSGAAAASSACLVDGDAPTASSPREDALWEEMLHFAQLEVASLTAIYSEEEHRWREIEFFLHRDFVAAATQEQKRLAEACIDEEFAALPDREAEGRAAITRQQNRHRLELQFLIRVEMRQEFAGDTADHRKDDDAALVGMRGEVCAPTTTTAADNATPASSETWPKAPEWPVGSSLQGDDPVVHTISMEPCGNAVASPPTGVVPNPSDVPVATPAAEEVAIDEAEHSPAEQQPELSQPPLTFDNSSLEKGGVFPVSTTAAVVSDYTPEVPNNTTTEFTPEKEPADDPPCFDGVPIGDVDDTSRRPSQQVWGGGGTTTTAREWDDEVFTAELRAIMAHAHHGTRSSRLSIDAAPPYFLSGLETRGHRVLPFDEGWFMLMVQVEAIKQLVQDGLGALAKVASALGGGGSTSTPLLPSIRTGSPSSPTPPPRRVPLGDLQCLLPRVAKGGDGGDAIVVGSISDDYAHSSRRGNALFSAVSIQPVRFAEGREGSGSSTSNASAAPATVHVSPAESHSDAPAPGGLVEGGPVAMRHPLPLRVDVYVGQWKGGKRNGLGIYEFGVEIPSSGVINNNNSSGTRSFALLNADAHQSLPLHDVYVGHWENGLRHHMGFQVRVTSSPAASGRAADPDSGGGGVSDGSGFSFAKLGNSTETFPSITSGVMEQRAAVTIVYGEWQRGTLHRVVWSTTCDA